jgi:hypothetical protein
VTATLTVNRQCTRCPRVEQTSIDVVELIKQAGPSGKLKDGPKALQISVDETPLIEFPFLCQPCTEIVARYLEHIAKKPKHQSALRAGAKIDVEEDDET